MTYIYLTLFNKSYKKKYPISGICWCLRIVTLHEVQGKRQRYNQVFNTAKNVVYEDLHSGTFINLPEPKYILCSEFLFRKGFNSWYCFQCSFSQFQHCHTKFKGFNSFQICKSWRKRSFFYKQPKRRKIHPTGKLSRLCRLCRKL